MTLDGRIYAAKKRGQMWVFPANVLGAESISSIKGIIPRRRLFIPTGGVELNPKISASWFYRPAGYALWAWAASSSIKLFFR